MVFPSIPAFLDPSNWNQQAHQIGGINTGGGSGEALQLPPRAVSGAPRPVLGVSGMPAMAAQPGSMAERARLTKAPQPDPALKCPRCDSTNTKFCYYNNYSLSQPRHFCKTCRRYWTRGGTLRSVPVGGGCRRNKRSKSCGGSSSKSSAVGSSADHQQPGGGSGGTTSSSTASTAAPVIPLDIPMPHQLPFMASLQPLGDYAPPNLGLGFSGMQAIGMPAPDTAEYHWRGLQLQQLPFLGSMEPPAPSPAPVASMFRLDLEGGDIEGGGVLAGQVAAKAAATGNSGFAGHLGSVKMEDNPQGGLSLARRYLGIPQNDNIWGAGSGGGGGGGSGNNREWMMDLSGFNPSSAGNLL